MGNSREDDQTQLYRHFDAAGRLLYVGISLSAVSRLGSHMAESEWASQIVKVTIQTLASRDEALYAEALAIECENPLHNRYRPSPAQRLPKGVCQTCRGLPQTCKKVPRKWCELIGPRWELGSRSVPRLSLRSSGAATFDAFIVSRGRKSA